MNRTATITLAATLLLAGCGGDPKPAASPTKAVARDVISGQPLSHYKGMPSYDWRVRLVDTHAEVEKQLHTISGSLSKDSLDDVLNTCDAIARGGKDVVGQTVTRFSEAQPPLTRAQARKVIAVSKRLVCP